MQPGANEAVCEVDRGLGSRNLRGSVRVRQATCATWEDGGLLRPLVATKMFYRCLSLLVTINNKASSTYPHPTKFVQCPGASQTLKPSLYAVTVLQPAFIFLRDRTGAEESRSYPVNSGWSLTHNSLCGCAVEKTDRWNDALSDTVKGKRLTDGIGIWDGECPMESKQESPF